MTVASSYGIRGGAVNVKKILDIVEIDLRLFKNVAVYNGPLLSSESSRNEGRRSRFKRGGS